jgi:two-component system sensor histidine kinase TctE
MPWKWIEKASLRLRLLVLLLPTMALVMLSNLWFTRSDALSAGNAAYDRSLLGAIKSLDANTSTASGGLSVELPYRLFEFFQLTASGQVYFRVATADNLVEIGHPDLPPPPQPLRSGVPQFYDAQYFGESVRIGAFMRPLDPAHRAGEQLVIQVAESTKPRETFTHDLLLRAAWRDFGLWSVTGLCVALGLSLALRPLTRLAAHMRGRQAQDLRALPGQGLPQDLRPLVDVVNEQLARTEKLMDERRAFIDDASHQLRTPLTVLKTQLEYTLRNSAPHELPSALHALSAELSHAIRATNQLLSLGQSDATMLREEAFDLTDLLRSTALALLPLARTKGQDLGVDVPQETLMARGDRHLLEQALLNVTHNALTHNREKGAVTLRAGIEHQTQWITVTDDGPGIPPDIVSRLGQRFVKSKQSRGSGLGLAIACSVMQRHSGQVTSTVDPSEHQHTVRLTWPHT